MGVSSDLSKKGVLLYFLYLLAVKYGVIWTKKIIKRAVPNILLMGVAWTFSKKEVLF